VGEHERPAPAERGCPERPLRLHRRPELRGERRRSAPRGCAAGAAEAPGRPDLRTAPRSRLRGGRAGVRKAARAGALALGEPGGQRPARRPPRGRHGAAPADGRRRSLEPRPDRCRRDRVGRRGRGRGRSARGSDRADHDPRIRPAELGPEGRQVPEGGLVLAVHPRRRSLGGSTSPPAGAAPRFAPSPGAW
jgi:hypothetical protein